MSTEDDAVQESGLGGILEEAAIGAFFLFGGGTLSTILSAICGILVARLLGPELYGAYSLAFTVVGFLALFTGLGVNSAVTRFVSYHSARREYSRITRFIEIGLLFTVLESLVIYAIGYLLLNHVTKFLVNRPELSEPTLFLLPIVVFQALFNVATGMLIGFSDARRVAYSNILLQLSRLLLAPLLILIGYGLAGSLLGNTVAYAIGGAISTIYVFMHYKRIKKEISNDGAYSGYLLSMLSYGLPLYMASIATLLVDTYRNSLLSYIAGDFVVGNFNVALRFTVVLSIFMAPISTILFPAFSKIASNGRDLARLFKIALKYSTILVVPITVLSIAMSREIIVLFFGRRYYLAPVYYSIIAMNYLYVGIGYMILSSLFSGIGRPRVNFNASVIYSLVFVVSSSILVYLANLMEYGLLYSMLIATGSSTLYGLWILRKDYDITVDYRDILGVYAASIISLTPILTLSYLSLGEGVFMYIAKLFIGVFLYTALYVTLLPVFKGINRDDINGLSRLLGRIKPLKPLIDLLLGYQLRVLDAVHS